MQVTISTPGSKSISNRALFLSAFCDKAIKFQNLSKCDDTLYMQKGLQKLKTHSPSDIYTGNAGTTTRFLTAIATLSNKKIIIKGDKRMSERPIKPLTDALNKLGADIETVNGCPPLTINKTKLKGGTVTIPGNISSQYISALLMLGAFTKKGIKINIAQKLYSKPYIIMTIKVMEDFGIKVVNKNFRQFDVIPQNPNPPDKYIIESDASSASYIGAYAALHPEKTIKIENLSKNSIQGDIKFIEYLEQMGCETTKMQIKGPTILKNLGKIDMNDTPDLVMTFAVLAAFAKGTTHITNIGNLRIKETDRLKALKNELKKLDIKVETSKDSIKIKGNPNLKANPPLKKITIETYSDHRMAMSFGILLDLIPRLTIKNPECVSKSYTTFWKDLKLMEINQNNSTTKLSIFNSMVKMLITAMSFFLGVYYNSIGLTGTQIGIIFALGTITSIITTLPSGLSNDKIKSKQMIEVALTLIAIFYFGLSQTHNFYLIALMALLGGMGGTIYTNSAESLFYKSTNKERISKKIGIFQGLNYLMIGLGMIAAGYLLEKNIEFEKLFLLISLAFATMAIISRIILPTTKTSEFELIKYKKDIFKPKVLMFMLIMFLFAIHFGAESTTYGLFLKKTLNLTILEMGLYMGSAIITMALSVLVISKNLHKWKTEHLLATGLFMSGSGHILMTINKPILSLLFRIVHETGDAAMMFFLYYGIMKLFDLKRIGGNAGIFLFVATIGSTLGAAVFGPMGETYGYNIPLIVSGVTTLLAFFLTLQFLNYFSHNHEHSTNGTAR